MALNMADVVVVKQGKARRGRKDAPRKRRVLPLFQEDAESGAFITVRRSDPNPAYLGTIDDVAILPDEVRAWLHEHDPHNRAKGARYKLSLTAGDGTFVRHTAFALAADPHAPPPETVKGPDPQAAALSMFVGMMDAVNSAYVARSREDARRAEEDHKRRLMEMREDLEARARRAERDADTRIERDRMFLAAQLKATGNRGGVREALSMMQFGMRLADGRKVEDEDPIRLAAGDVLRDLPKLATRMMGDDDDDDEADEAEAEAAADKPNGNGKPNNNGKPNGNNSQMKFLRWFLSLVKQLDAEALAASIRSLVAQGKVSRSFVESVGSGAQDETIGTLLDAANQAKLKAAIRIALTDGKPKQPRKRPPATTAARDSGSPGKAGADRPPGGRRKPRPTATS